MSTPPETLKKISPRAVAGLRAAGIETLEQAAAMDDAALLAVHGVAQASLMRIRSWQVDPNAPEAESYTESPTEKDRQDRTWDLYKGFLAQGLPVGSAYERAVAGVREFYRQAEAQP